MSLKIIPKQVAIPKTVLLGGSTSCEPQLSGKPIGHTMHALISQYTQFSVIYMYTESNATTLDYERNPAYIHFNPHSTESSPAAGQYSKNPAYNLIEHDAQPSSYQEPTYEAIPSDTDRIPHNVQGTQNVSGNQNPA